MMINYKEGVSLLTYGLFIEDENDKVKFNNILGYSLSEKISSFEDEKFYLTIKKDVANGIIEAINDDNTHKGIKKIREINIEDRISSYISSDEEIPIQLSLNEITELSKLIIDRKDSKISNKEKSNKENIILKELVSLSEELQKEGLFPIHNTEMKSILKIAQNDNLKSIDSELLKKIESNLLIISEKNKRKI